MNLALKVCAVKDYRHSELEWVTGAKRQNTQADNTYRYYRNQAENDTRITVEKTLPKHGAFASENITACPAIPEPE